MVQIHEAMPAREGRAGMGVFVGPWPWPCPPLASPLFSLLVSVPSLVWWVDHLKVFASPVNL